MILILVFLFLSAGSQFNIVSETKRAVKYF